jgi:hypothetical protein
VGSGRGQSSMSAKSQSLGMSSMVLAEAVLLDQVLKEAEESGSDFLSQRGVHMPACLCTAEVQRRDREIKWGKFYKWTTYVLRVMLSSILQATNEDQLSPSLASLHLVSRWVPISHRKFN